MNLKRLVTKEERMRAYAERHKRHERRPEFSPCRESRTSRLPICVGLQALADVWGATAREKHNESVAVQYPAR